MADSKRFKSFIIPMLASIVVLPCFLFYFLHTEYKKEKEAIILEERDEIFVQIFSNIDTLSSIQPQEDHLSKLKWVKDTTNVTVSYSLEYITDTIPLDTNLTALKQELESHPNLPSSKKWNKAFDDAIMNKDSCFELRTKKVHSHRKISIESTSSDSNFNSLKTKSFDIIQIFDEDNQPSFIVSNQEIDPLKILKRIIPQILFSLFLLICVWSAFYLIIKNFKEQQRLIEIRNDFMSNMTHELKTPVSTISVALEALRNFDAKNDPQLRKEYIDISKTEIDRLSLLVDKTLNISLYEQGVFSFSKQTLRLDYEIEAIAKTLSVQLQNQKVTLNIKKEGNDFSVHVDKPHITNVIHNLIENAIKYSPEYPHIDIIIFENNDTIDLSISDQGMGIPKTYQHRIFDKFFRIPEGNVHNTKGHGLGLSYVKEVIEGHQGTIKVQDNIPKGTTFIISLPKATIL